MGADSTQVNNDGEKYRPLGSEPITTTLKPRLENENSFLYTD